jgi:hypothetical protein
LNNRRNLRLESTFLLLPRDSERTRTLRTFYGLHAFLTSWWGVYGPLDDKGRREVLEIWKDRSRIKMRKDMRVSLSMEDTVVRTSHVMRKVPRTYAY